MRVGLGQLVVFTLGEEEYAVDISYAQEIIRIPQITKIPNVPRFIEGIINLRGKIIPILDLKERFNIGHTDRGIDSRLLILELDGLKAGIVVDDVSEVIKVEEQSIQRLDDEISSISKESIEGISLIGQRIIIVLNIIKLKSEIFNFNLVKGLVS